MRRVAYLASTGLLLGTMLSGCGLDDKAKEVASDQVRNACDGALRGAEESLVSQGEAGAGPLADELGQQLPSEYQEFAGTIAARITQQAQERDLSGALESAAPAETRAQWHDMAVDVCTQHLIDQAGNVVG